MRRFSFCDPRGDLIAMLQMPFTLMRLERMEPTILAGAPIRVWHYLDEKFESCWI